MAAPLDGIIVLAVEQAIAAPFCTRQLVDLGARVLKIERPGSGDFARDYDTTKSWSPSVLKSAWSCCDEDQQSGA